MDVPVETSVAPSEGTEDKTTGWLVVAPVEKVKIVSLASGVPSASWKAVPDPPGFKEIV